MTGRSHQPTRFSRETSGVGMQPGHPVNLLVGRDPDLLFLRSAVLASAGIWSLRVQNATQAMVALDKVSCDLAIVCYTSTKRANNNFSTTC